MSYGGFHPLVGLFRASIPALSVLLSGCFPGRHTFVNDEITFLTPSNRTTVGTAVDCATGAVVMCNVLPKFSVRRG